jgi:hypothetical protein
MRRHDSHTDRTLQDDRNKLQIDAEDDSPLVKGEGAPLAEDGVQQQPHAATTAPVGFVGGVPVPLGMDDVLGISTRRDKPIND